MNSVIATTPAGMLEAQTTMSAWCSGKLEEAQRELSVAESLFNQLDRAKIRTNAASTQIRKARVRIAFYEKVGAALAAGYYIIPPFDVQVFAIRTDRPPKASIGTHDWESDQEARRLPPGAGNYVDPRPERTYHDTITKTDSKGAETKVDRYENADWSQIGMPVRAMKPSIIEATTKALGEKIFDALGIAPAYRSADPLIVGQIRHYKQHTQPLTFFVAWWMDRDDL